MKHNDNGVSLSSPQICRAVVHPNHITHVGHTDSLPARHLLQASYAPSVDRTARARPADVGWLCYKFLHLSHRFHPNQRSIPCPTTNRDNPRTSWSHRQPPRARRAAPLTPTPRSQTATWSRARRCPRPSATSHGRPPGARSSSATSRSVRVRRPVSPSPLPSGHPR